MAPDNPTVKERIATLEEQVRGLREDTAEFRHTLDKALRDIKTEITNHVLTAVGENRKRIDYLEKVVILAVGIAIGSGLLGLGPLIGLWK